MFIYVKKVVLFLRRYILNLDLTYTFLMSLLLYYELVLFYIFFTSGKWHFSESFLAGHKI